MTNPWTIGIAAAAIGGFALWKKFRHGTEKQLRKVIQSEYGVSVKDMSVLSQVKALGEAQFGKGQVKRHLLETVRLDAAKELIMAYAEQTGQNASRLSTNAQFADPTFAANNFSQVNGAQVVTPPPPSSASGPSSGGTVFARAMDKVRAKIATPGSGGTAQGAGAPPAAGGGQSGPPLTGVLMLVAEALHTFQQKYNTESPGVLVGRGAAENPEAIGRANNTALKSGTVRSEQQQRLGMRNG